MRAGVIATDLTTELATDTDVGTVIGVGVGLANNAGDAEWFDPARGSSERLPALQHPDRGRTRANANRDASTKPDTRFGTDLTRIVEPAGHRAHDARTIAVVRALTGLRSG